MRQSSEGLKERIAQTAPDLPAERIAELIDVHTRVHSRLYHNYRFHYIALLYVKLH